MLNDHSEGEENIVVDEAQEQTLLNMVMSGKNPSGPIYKRYVNDANDQPWNRFDKWSTDIDMSEFDTEIEWYKHIKYKICHVKKLHLQL